VVLINNIFLHLDFFNSRVTLIPAFQMPLVIGLYIFPFLCLDTSFLSYYYVFYLSRVWPANELGHNKYYELGFKTRSVWMGENG
jgi:hypothetical protein